MVNPMTIPDLLQKRVHGWFVNHNINLEHHGISQSRMLRVATAGGAL
jgi:hypothetical protein